MCHDGCAPDVAAVTARAAGTFPACLVIAAHAESGRVASTGACLGVQLLQQSLRPGSACLPQARQTACVRSRLLCAAARGQGSGEPASPRRALAGSGGAVACHRPHARLLPSSARPGRGLSRRRLRTPRTLWPPLAGGCRARAAAHCCRQAFGADQAAMSNAQSIQTEHVSHDAMHPELGSTTPPMPSGGQPTAAAAAQPMVHADVLVYTLHTACPGIHSTPFQGPGRSVRLTLSSSSSHSTVSHVDSITACPLWAPSGAGWWPGLCGQAGRAPSSGRPWRLCTPAAAGRRGACPPQPPPPAPGATRSIAVAAGCGAGCTAAPTVTAAGASWGCRPGSLCQRAAHSSCHTHHLGALPLSGGRLAHLPLAVCLQLLGEALSVVSVLKGEHAVLHLV